MIKGVDFIGVALVYFCHDGNGRFVMGKRNNNTTDEHDRWDVGGGKLEFGDTIESTLKREILEEYCTDVLEFEFLGYRDVHRVHQGKKTHWIALDFKVLIDPKKVKNGEPHKFNDVGWFTLENVPKPENLHSQMPNFFNLYAKKLSKQ